MTDHTVNWIGKRVLKFYGFVLMFADDLTTGAFEHACAVMDYPAGMELEEAKRQGRKALHDRFHEQSGGNTRIFDDDIYTRVDYEFKPQAFVLYWWEKPGAPYRPTRNISGVLDLARMLNVYRRWVFNDQVIIHWWQDEGFTEMSLMEVIIAAHCAFRDAESPIWRQYQNGVFSIFPENMTLEREREDVQALYHYLMRRLQR